MKRLFTLLIPLSFLAMADVSWRLTGGPITTVPASRWSPRPQWSWSGPDASMSGWGAAGGAGRTILSLHA